MAQTGEVGGVWSCPVLSCGPNTQAVGEAQQRLVLVQALLGLFTRAQHHISGWWL